MNETFPINRKKNTFKLHIDFCINIANYDVGRYMVSNIASDVDQWYMVLPLPPCRPVRHGNLRCFKKLFRVYNCDLYQMCSFISKSLETHTNCTYTLTMLLSLHDHFEALRF